eukprot:CAMPEP_0117612276 /NCGR_PEP_ID=MMETSP0784-20121206/82867_1 /TAXON_ID=39447 /ORGANISM="" /LENGTH=134 /DNA_ID=CAMNT_0005415829 /DNA_START=50 /DNA_END=450 /DNA_ORIENTATION=-
MASGTGAASPCKLRLGGNLALSSRRMTGSIDTPCSESTTTVSAAPLGNASQLRVTIFASNDTCGIAMDPVDVIEVSAQKCFFRGGCIAVLVLVLGITQEVRSLRRSVIPTSNEQRPPPAEHENQKISWSRISCK